MSDLISRKAVITTIHNYFRGLIDKGMREIDVVDCNAELCKEVDNIEVAYNMDKVVEQLGECERYVYDAVSDEDSYVIDTEKAIEIVKGAVKDEYISSNNNNSTSVNSNN